MTAQLVDVRLSRFDRVFDREPWWGARVGTATAAVVAVGPTEAHLGLVRATAASWPLPDGPGDETAEGAAGALVHDAHLRADAAGRLWPVHADVLTAEPARTFPAATRRVAELLGRGTGCLLAAVPLRGGGGLAVGVRGGTLRSATLPRVPEAGPRWAAVVSVMHTWLVAGLPIDQLLEAEIWTYELGG